MEKYNYLENIKVDVKNYIDENIDFSNYDNMKSFTESLYDELFDSDKVTGGGSNSYTYDRETAEGYLKGNLDLLSKAGETIDILCDLILKEGAEACDVAIRRSLLLKALNEVLKDYSITVKKYIDGVKLNEYFEDDDLYFDKDDD